MFSNKSVFLSPGNIPPEKMLLKDDNPKKVYYSLRPIAFSFEPCRFTVELRIFLLLRSSLIELRFKINKFTSELRMRFHRTFRLYRAFKQHFCEIHGYKKSRTCRKAKISISTLPQQLLLLPPVSYLCQKHLLT